MGAPESGDPPAVAILSGLEEGQMQVVLMR